MPRHVESAALAVADILRDSLQRIVVGCQARKRRINNSKSGRRGIGVRHWFGCESGLRDDRAFVYLPDPEVLIEFEPLANLLLVQRAATSFTDLNLKAAT